MKRVGVAVVAVVGFAGGFGGAALHHGGSGQDPKEALAARAANEWPTLEQLPPIARPRTGAMTTQVAPVESLLTGLEARLAAQPDDMKGWALLAQSYAFVGNGAAAESAVQRAVALGFDEQELRNSVGHARREPGRATGSNK